MSLSYPWPQATAVYDCAVARFEDATSILFYSIKLVLFLQLLHLLLLLSNCPNVIVLVWLKRHKGLKFQWVLCRLYLSDVQIEQAVVWRWLFRACVALFEDLWFRLTLYNLILEIQAIILRHFWLRCSH